jgi:hypothetical protein
MGLQNPLNYIFDNPNNPLEQAKNAIGDAAQSALDSSFGKGVVSALETPLKALEYVAKPYRDWAAPKLSAALLMANSNYREQNKNLNFMEQFYHGQDLAREGADPNNPWRRSVSPGRALVGLIGDWTPGTQGTDKLNWEDSKQVNDFFTSGSAQFFSGLSDIGFNILDPVAAGITKATSVARRQLIERPIAAVSRPGLPSKGIEPAKLVAELQDAVNNPESNTAAAQIFKLVENDPKDVTTISNYGFVRHSTDPARLATAISVAHESAGRQGVADVIGAALGHKQSYDKVMAQSAELQQHLQVLNNTTDKVQKDLNELRTVLAKPDEVDSAKLSAKIAAEKSYQKQLKVLDEERSKTEKKLVPSTFIAEREQPITSTWSKYSVIEQVRAASAQAQTKGLMIDVNPSKEFSFNKEVTNNQMLKHIPKPAIRYLMWLSPDSQVREAPAGIAFLAGAGGDRSYLEADARIRNIAKLAKLPAEKQISLRNEYRTLSTKSERNFFLEKLQSDSVEWLLQKHYGKELEVASPTQREALQIFARELIDSTRRAQSRSVEKALDKNYTVVDGLSGDYVSHAYLHDLVEKNALEIAISNNRNSVVEADRIAARKAMKSNPLFETQVPNVHFSYDFKLWDEIMSENPTLLGNMVRAIVEEDWSPKKVASEMKRAEESSIAGTNGFGQATRNNVKLMYDVATEGLDSFYTYLWKPVTLMSLKYTSRNVGEGWMRMVACMADYHANLGYKWTDMFKSGVMPDSGTFKRTVDNRVYRKKLKSSSAEFEKKNEQMLLAEGNIKKQLRAPTQKTTKILARFRKDMEDGVAEARFKQEDGITMCVTWMKDAFGRLEKYKSTKNVEADSAAKYLNEVANPIIFSPKTPDTDAGLFVTALASGDYRQAQIIAETANSTELAKALSDYGLQVKKVLEEINPLKETGATTVDNALRATKFGLERLVYHLDTANSLLITRAGLRDEIMNISKKASVDGKITKSYTKKEHVEIYPGVFIDQSLAGKHDDMLRNATSSRASTTGILSDDRRLTAHSLLTAGFARRIVSRAEKDWANAHADYVNNVLMRDTVARRIVQDIADGLPEAQAVKNAKDWVKAGSPDAVRWKNEINQNIVNRGQSMSSKFYDFNNQIDEILAQIYQHIPLVNAETGLPYVGMQENALKGFTVEDSLNLSYANRHDVMAAREITNTRIDNLYKNAVSKIFDFVGTMPEDHLVRHPFFNMVHDNEAKRIAKRLAGEGKRNGMSDKEIQDFILSRKDAIKNTATNRAYKELMTKLYSVERYTDPGRFMRFLTPFYMAHQNSSRFWLGQSLRNPQVAIFLAKAYNAPYRAGYVYDDQGNIVSAGHPWESNANIDQIVLHAPAWLRKFGVGDASGRIATPVNSLDIITQGQYPVLPTVGGPVVQPILSAALKKAAQYDGLDKFITDTTGMTFDEFTNHFIMPFYTRQESTSVAGSIVANTVPLNSWMVSAVAGLSAGNFPLPSVQARWTSRYQEAMKQITVEAQLSGTSMSPEKMSQEATRMARKSLAFEAVSAGVGPVAAFKVKSETLDTLRARQNSLVSKTNYNEGNIKFIEELESQGIDNSAGIVSVLTSSAVDNRYGFVANTKTLSGVRNNIKSLSTADTYYPDNPFIGELFNQTTPGVNDRSTIADDAMYSISINGKPLKSRNMSNVEIERQRQLRAGWADYFNYVDFINSVAEQKGYEVGSQQYRDVFSPLKDKIEEFVGSKYPLWATRPDRVTLHKSDAFIALANHFINDKQFMKTVGKNNDAIKGLQEYMHYRNIISTAFQNNINAGGYVTLDAQANKRFSLAKDMVAKYVISRHKGFQQMYKRYLADDELRPIPTQLSEAGK